MEQEIWKDIQGYEDIYQVSNLGRVKSLPKWRISKRYGQSDFILKPLNDHGYSHVCLTSNKKQKYIRIHKLVAKTFIPNHENKPQINHINGIKTDNRVENLEWCTASENLKHAFRTGLHTPVCLGKTGQNHPTSKLVLDTATGIFYETRNDAAKAKNMPSNTLSNMLNGVHKNKTSLIYV